MHVLWNLGDRKRVVLLATCLAENMAALPAGVRAVAGSLSDDIASQAETEPRMFTPRRRAYRAGPELVG
jgi:hypothetical protein